MNREPLITVITVSYYSEYLYEAIDSVLAQSYPRIEYIVSDDGTEDFNVKDVERYIDTNKRTNIEAFQVIHHEKNVGTVRNLNLALKVSHGDYIFNLAADDVYADIRVLENWVLEMIEQQSDLSVGCFQQYNLDFTKRYYSLPTEYQKQLLRSKDTSKIFFELTIGNFIYGCSTARSRKCIEKFGFYDEKYRLVEDYSYALSFLRNGGRIDLFDCICVNYRQGGVSSPKRFNGMYERDSDLIFQNEIKPYVRWKWLYRLIYAQWKKNQKEGFWEKINTCGTFKKIILYAKNPVQIYISGRSYILRYKSVLVKRRM